MSTSSIIKEQLKLHSPILGSKDRNQYFSILEPTIGEFMDSIRGVKIAFAPPPHPTNLKKKAI